MLFDGKPGVGKTEGAKYLAGRFNVPLYRVDMGAIKYKYVGTSEENLQQVLSQLDNQEPCVALFDEIEKMVGGGDDSGVTMSMMSQLLWWLAEHRTKVFVVMTTNNLEKIPKELYREGRIDEVFTFVGIEKPKALSFCDGVFSQFDPKFTPPVDVIKEGIDETFNGQKEISHAKLTQMVYRLVKQTKIANKMTIPLTGNVVSLKK